MKKTQIVEELGEGGLLLPVLIEDALRANDRAKLRMTALQEAVANATGSARPSRPLDADARAAGAPDDALDAAIAGARLMAKGDKSGSYSGSYSIPGARRLTDGILDDIALMAAPLEAAKDGAAPAFSGRLATLRTMLASDAGDVVDDTALARITSARRGAADTAHLLVMDLHKALNQLAAAVAVETVAGAHALGLHEEDKPRVEAFMRGLSRTRGLVFGHPGLDTMASRSGEKLILQNDIGTTDAHVLIVTVEGMTATVTYTDIHRARAKFFVNLFKDFGADWTPLAERSSKALSEGTFLLVNGRYAATGTKDLDAFLEGIGARVPFLIDWNKARKALQTFVDKPTAIRLLTDAARAEVGHRGFLELGGAELIFDAVHHSAEGRVPYGARLDKVLGNAAVTSLLGEVLTLTSRGLCAHRSIRLIKDEVRAELARRFGSAEQEMLALALRQLGLTRMLAARLAGALDGGEGLPPPARQAFGIQAKRLEEKADRQILSARDLASGPFPRGRRFLPVAESIENATDAFGEAAFLLSVARLPKEPAASGALSELARVAVACASDLVRAVAAACESGAGQREDITEALEAVDAVIEGERRADVSQRRILAAAFSESVPAETLVASVEVARALETGTDHLARAALALRGCVLEETAP